MSFGNPILGGASTLIREAIKSPNYSVGVSGWTVNRGGTAEFNDATVRGAVSAGAGTVLLNAGGLNIHSSVTGKQSDININAQFLARRYPDDGQSQAQLVVDSALGGEVILNAIPSTVAGISLSSALIFASRTDTVTDSTPKLTIQGTRIAGKATPSIILSGGNSTSNVSNANIQADTANTFGDLTVGGELKVTGRFNHNPVALYTVSKSIPNGAVTQFVNADFTAIRDLNGLYNNGLFVTDRAGIWELSVFGRWDSQAAVAGQRQIRCQLNGVDFQYASLSPTTALNNTLITNQMQWQDLLGANVLVGLQAFQNSGVAATYGHDARVCFKLVQEF